MTHGKQQKDHLTHSDFRAVLSTGFVFTAQREIIDRRTLQRRLRLTLVSIKAVVCTGEHGETETALR